MNIQVIKILIILMSLLCSCSGISKNNAFNRSGQWLSANRMLSTTKFDTGQIENKPERVKVTTSQTADHYIYSVENTLSGIIEFKAAFEFAENAYTVPPMPVNLILGKGESQPVLSIKPLDKRKPWRFKIHWDIIPGMPLYNYVAKIAYLSPVAKNRAFYISQGFNGKGSHKNQKRTQYAIDIAMPINMPIYAARAGIVMQVEMGFSKSGRDESFINEANLIRIAHNDGTIATYAHLAFNQAQVKEGEKVNAGQLIGYSGNTGYSTGPHLHFVINYNNGTEEVSAPFQFLTNKGKLETPIQGNYLRGF